MRARGVVAGCVAAVALAGCGHTHSTAPALVPHTGTMTASVNDTAWAARDSVGNPTGVEDNTDIGGLPVYVIAGIEQPTRTDGSILLLLVPAAPRVGHVDLGTIGQGAFLRIRIAGADTSVVFYGTDDTHTGTLIISEADPNGARGSFSFTAVDSAGTGLAVVTNGQFDVARADSAIPLAPARALVRQALVRAASRVAAAWGRPAAGPAPAPVGAQRGAKRGVAPGQRL
ncbi:MAG TPA: hypothetical protein VFK69_04510 [Candidatus Eisenbacteria bacterium]|nr:hypothetical protein [Candidatus Eisenbacteria bacterium]